MYAILFYNILELSKFDNIGFTSTKTKSYVMFLQNSPYKDNLGLKFCLLTMAFNDTADDKLKCNKFMSYTIVLFSVVIIEVIQICINNI